MRCVRFVNAVAAAHGGWLGEAQLRRQSRSEMILGLREGVQNRNLIGFIPLNERHEGIGEILFKLCGVTNVLWSEGGKLLGENVAAIWRIERQDEAGWMRNNRRKLISGRVADFRGPEIRVNVG